MATEGTGGGGGDGDVVGGGEGGLREGGKKQAAQDRLQEVRVWFHVFQSLELAYALFSNRWKDSV